MLFLGSPNKITGDVTFAVDWVLKTDYLSIYPFVVFPMYTFCFYGALMLYDTSALSHTTSKCGTRTRIN